MKIVTEVIASELLDSDCDDMGRWMTPDSYFESIVDLITSQWVICDLATNSLIQKMNYSVLHYQTHWQRQYPGFPHRRLSIRRIRRRNLGIAGFMRE